MTPTAWCSDRRGSLRAAAAVVVVMGFGPGGDARAIAQAPTSPPAGALPTAVGTQDRLGYRARYAFVDVAAVARVTPYWDGAHVVRLQSRTPDGTDEVVRVFERKLDRDGREWARVSLPILPNGRSGWVPRSVLGEVRITRQWLRIDRRALRMTLVENGRVTFTARIGIGQPRWPTPAGEFVVRSRLSGRTLGRIYGPLALGLNARSAVLTDWPGGGFIGIHGTNEPGLLPGRVSHGCIRLRNAEILRLGRLLRTGTPVSIR